MKTGNWKKRLSLVFISLTCVMIVGIPLINTISSLDNEVDEITSQFNLMRETLTENFNTWKEKVTRKYNLKLNIDPVSYFLTKIESIGKKVVTALPLILSMTFEWLLLYPLFIYFLFTESKNVKSRFLSLIPNPIFEKTYMLFSEFNRKFSDYLSAKLIEAFIVGGLITFGLWIIGFPYAFFLGVLAGITNILPYIGPVIGFVPAVFFWWLNKSHFGFWEIGLVYILANIVDIIMVFPLLVSKIVNLHPIAVILSVLIGSQIGGIVGMIICIPVVAFIKLLADEIIKDLYAHE